MFRWSSLQLAQLECCGYLFHHCCRYSQLNLLLVNYLSELIIEIQDLFPCDIRHSRCFNSLRQLSFQLWKPLHESPSPFTSHWPNEFQLLSYSCPPDFFCHFFDIRMRNGVSNTCSMRDPVYKCPLFLGSE